MEELIDGIKDEAIEEDAEELGELPMTSVIPSSAMAAAAISQRFFCTRPKSRKNRPSPKQKHST